MFRLADAPVYFVNLHVIGYRRVRTPEIARVREVGPTTGQPDIKKRRVDFDVDGVHETRIYAREKLQAGFAAIGPLIFEEPAATTLVHQRQRLTVDSFGNLVIHLAA